MSIRRNKVLYDDSAAGNGDWIALDTRYEQNPVGRSIKVTMTAGDTITLQGITKDEKGIDKSFLDALIAEDITDLKIYTQTENDVLDGSWTYIRIVKAGTSGDAYVEGFV